LRPALRAFARLPFESGQRWGHSPEERTSLRTAPNPVEHNCPSSPQLPPRVSGASHSGPPRRLRRSIFQLPQRRNRSTGYRAKKKGRGISPSEQCDGLQRVQASGRRAPFLVGANGNKSQPRAVGGEQRGIPRLVYRLPVHTISALRRTVAWMRRVGARSTSRLQPIPITASNLLLGQAIRLRQPLYWGQRALNRARWRSPPELVNFDASIASVSKLSVLSFAGSGARGAESGGVVSKATQFPVALNTDSKRIAVMLRPPMKMLASPCSAIYSKQPKAHRYVRLSNVCSAPASGIIIYAAWQK